MTAPQLDDASSILFGMIKALAPPPKIKPSEFASNLILPRSSNARGGRLRLSCLQAQIADLVTPETRELRLATSAQVGKTTLILTLMGHAMQQGAPMLLVRPDTADAESFYRENLSPLIEASPVLKSIVTHSNAQGLQGPGFSLGIASAYKAPQLSGRAIRWAAIDELERAPRLTSNGESEPSALVRRRLHTFRNSLLILASTPLLVEGRIWQAYLEGSQHRPFVTCEHCDEDFIIEPSQIQFEPGKPDGATLHCPHCSVGHDEAARLRLIAKCELRPTNPSAPPGIISVSCWEGNSEFSSLQRIAAQIDAAKTIEQKRTLQNLCFGRPYETAADIEVSPDDLMSRAVPLAAPYDKSFAFATAAIDVQSNRVELQWMLHSANGSQRAIVDHVQIFGDTSGATVWQELDSALGRTFPTADRRELTPSVTFCDAGFATEQVCRFVLRQRANGRRTYATFGRSGWNRVLVREGAKVKGLLRGLIVGVDPAKLDVAKSLQSGAIKLADHFDAEVYQQFCAERLETTYRKGFPVQAWVKSPEMRNEAFDTAILNYVAASLVNGRASRSEDKAKPQTTTDIASRLAALNSNYRRAA